MNQSELKNRNYMFDNLKGFLIILVVFMHILEIKNEGIFLYIRSAVYIFHMPLFILISGYFSKSVVKNKAKIKNTFQNCLIPYLIFNTLYIIVMRNFSIKNIFTPQFIYWYFFCLFVWRLILPLIYKINKYALIGVSFILSVCVGFIPFLDEFLSLQRLIAFLPYFLIGFYFDNEKIEKIRKIKKQYCVVSLVILIALSSFLYTDVFANDSLLNIQCYTASKMNNINGAFARIISFVLALLISVCIVNIFSSNQNVLTTVGQRTALIYPASAFAQAVILKCLKIINLRDIICESYLLTFIVGAVSTFITVSVFSDKHIYNLYKNVMNKINSILFFYLKKEKDK